MSDLRTLADLISEKDAYDRYAVFADRELREARQRGEIEYYDLRKGVFYSEAQLIAYVEKHLRRPIQNRPLMPEAPDNQPRIAPEPENDDAALIAKSLEARGVTPHKRKRRKQS